MKSKYFPYWLLILWLVPGRAVGETYVWRNVAMGGGGFVSGMVFQPAAKNLIYARTDVGGAYRWDDSAQHWVPLTDWVGAGENNLMGIESVAPDPSDPQRVYLAAGMYSGGAAAILRSADQGRTFQQTALPVGMGGNETGRFNGERLAVDPHDGKILFFGSRHDGLWRSGDRSVTWQKVTGFPNLSAMPPVPPAPANNMTNAGPRFRRGFGKAQAVGIVSVVFDSASGKPGTATPVIYAAVSGLGTNVYFSADAGVNWLAVAGQPLGLRPNHLVRAPDGRLYLTYGREPGPNSMSDGAVWKFDPSNGVWTNITPLTPAAAGESFGYGGLAVDAQHPATLMVATFDHWQPHDFIYRSTNGGASWTQLWRDDTEWDHTSAPYTRTRSPHWMGSLAINPANPDQVLLSTGFGIWACVNATAADAGRPTRWVFLDDGLEETVPLALISPPTGVHLLSGVGDIDGFRHADLAVSPAGGTFAGPRFSNTEDLAFAGQQSRVIVRTGSAGNQQVHAAISRDDGTTWQRLASEPPGGNGAGAISIAADAQTIVWTPRGSTPAVTRDAGTNWTPCGGLAGGQRVVADPVNPQRFYAYDGRAGTVMVSTNGAVSFTVLVAVLDPAGNAGSRYGGDGGAALVVTPGWENDLWLASRSAGLFQWTNGAAHFSKLASIEQAGSLGLGKAPPGKAFPALFLAGRIAGQQGLFRSDDAGENWTRINDDAHQYGYISHVTGDPRVYGRVYFATGGRGVIYGDRQEGPTSPAN